MNTINRINALFAYCKLGEIDDYPDENAHEHLNRVDSAIGADTEWLSSSECGCLWHIGKTCGNRRAVGARVKMLEEVVALNDLKKKFSM